MTGAGGAAAAGIAAAPAFGPLTTAPAAAAVAGMAGVLAAWPLPHRRVALIAGAAGTVSLAATAALRSLGAASPTGGLWMPAEAAGLLALTALVVRVARDRRAVLAAGLAGAAVPLSLLRFTVESSPAVALGGLAFWSALVLLAAAVGLYLRALDDARVRSVAAARRAQRLRLARDLHDFVAHDVSEVLAQAQAGQVVAEGDPRTTMAIFRRIEQAAQRAMASMDRTVHMLHEEDERADGIAPLPALADLPALAERFAAAAGAATLRLAVDPRLTDRGGDAVPREVGATAYRIVVEALTNVRRHAPAANMVEVAVRRVGWPGARAAVEVTVTDDGQPGSAPVPDATAPRHAGPPAGAPPNTGRAAGPDTGSRGRRAPDRPPARPHAVGRNGAPHRTGAGDGAPDGSGPRADGSPATRSGTDAPAERTGGLGLPGLAERARVLGGELVAGPRPDGGWRVRATLPFAPGPHRPPEIGA